MTYSTNQIKIHISDSKMIIFFQVSVGTDLTESLQSTSRLKNGVCFLALH